MIRRFWWVVVMFGALTATLAAVLVRLSGYYYVPNAIGSTLDWFASPGEFIWLSAIGGVFAGYPSTLTGYIVLIVSNTVFWTVTVVGVARACKWVLTHLRLGQTTS